MNRNILRYVIAVYEEQSMTKASQKLFVAQPSLSQSIRLLEEDLGTNLFDRTKTPLKVTEAGEIFVHWAKYILASEQQMRKHIAAIASGKLRKLAIGVLPQMCQEVLPDILQKFYSVVTGCSIVIKECSLAEAKVLLENNSIDILVGRPNSDYENVSVVEESVLVSVPKLLQLPIIQQGEYPFINISVLTGLPFIYISENEYFADMVRALFKQIKSNPNIVLECPSFKVAHMMVSHNVGIALLPEYCVRNNKYPDVCYYKLYEYPLSHTVTILHRKDRPLTDDAIQLISIIKDNFMTHTNQDSVND